jgi:hypothetical protein
VKILSSFFTCDVNIISFPFSIELIFVLLGRTKFLELKKGLHASMIYESLYSLVPKGKEKPTEDEREEMSRHRISSLKSEVFMFCAGSSLVRYILTTDI